MPKKSAELSALAVRNLVEPGLHPVGGVAGLCLSVKPSGARSWILRVTIGGKRSDVGLGGYPDVTLAGARDKARAMRQQIEAGEDPIIERQQARARLAATKPLLTFDQATEKYLSFKVREFRNRKHAAQWRRTLETYASPIIGRMPVEAIELQHLVEVLEPIWLSKTETAKRLRGRIENVLSWATVAGYRNGDNPARWRGNLDAVLPKPGKVASVEHHRALPIDAVPAVYGRLLEHNGMASSALRFLILTATRSGEVRGCTWSEIDLPAKVWTIPAPRMKAGKEHRIPLSAAAVELLEALPRDEGTDLVFTHDGRRPLSDATLSALLRRMGIAAVPHGFRSSFRDWCSERTAYPRDVAEMALAHTIGNKVEAAYRRGDLLAKRRRLMDEWSAFCTSPRASGEVVAIRS